MHYNKLYSSLIGSSLWTENDRTRILFITLLAMADKNGIIYGTRLGLERIANIEPTPLESFDDPDFDPFAALMAADLGSTDMLRNPENEGRRIEAVEGGFKLINFGYYQTLMASDTRAEQNRLAQRTFRAKQKADHNKIISSSNQASAEVSDRNTSQAEAEAQAEASTETRVRGSKSNWLTEDDVWIDLQRILPDQEVKDHIGLWIKRIKENRAALYEAVCDYKDKRAKRKIKNVAAWLTQRYQHFKKRGGMASDVPPFGKLPLAKETT